MHLIRSIPVDAGFDLLAATDAAFDFSGSGNIEIATAWLELAGESGYVFAAPEVDRALEDFLTRHGRALYVMRVYAKLATSPQGLARAKEIFAVARPTYHPVTQGAIDRVLARAE